MTAMEVVRAAGPRAMLLHPSLFGDPYSPYLKTHRVFPTEILLTKKSVGDPFGVALHYECRTALVPRWDATSLERARDIL